MIHGSCLCGRITYKASGNLGPYVFCHCRSCRKASGSAFAANIPVAAEAFEVLTGEQELKAYESSPGKRRYFCGNCGSPLFTKVGDDPRVVRVRLGTLDTRFGDKPAAHIFAGESPAWHDIADSLPRFDGWPDSSELRIPGSRQVEETNIGDQA